MLDSLLLPFHNDFMQRALLASIAVSAVCAVVGVFVVQRGLAFLGDGLAHAAFGGIAIGLFLGAGLDNAVWIAIPFTALIAVGIGFILRRTNLRGDVATGVFFSFSFALGVVFLKLRKGGPAVELETLLFGNVLTITPTVLTVVLAVAAIGLVLTILLWSRTAYALFDPELARISGVNVAALEYLLLAQTAVIVVVAVKCVGVVLVSSFLVIPAAASRLLGSSLARATVIATSIGVIGAVVGLWASFYLNTSAYAVIILLYSAVFGIALVVSRLRR
ncbi:MAG TPA: metal ABC transporter permease [Kofleriaceae bacterium]|nr:metal ABC transporter permease [Kofleriaceae bacterium]